ncbi:Tfp pilus assembly, pilus retraction ATPase PilT [Legionella beliardensis]|uniref:Tfp pilus assembly, pilus retraction ATPase PilT n=2 Tax=Legionella beliardensis TaxID=91822 RepID=A0A378JPJ3_9GAMM|nr:Tfp pilus assembly, pilus retraction ATPase PilT [Legionella beliardensis]
MVAGISNASLFPEKSEYYYQLGGGSDVYVPAISHTEKVTIGGQLNADGMLNCAAFNPAVTIGNSFNGIKDKIAGVPASLIDGLKGGVAGYPMYKLSQSMPALYNIIQNTAFSAQNEFQMRLSDCHRVKTNLENGSSPISALLSVSDSEGWIESAQRAATNNKNAPVDITESSKTIAQKSEEYGIPWVHKARGNSGGKYQAPIEVISDVVIAGYNVLLNPSRALDDKASVPNTVKKNNPFTHTWASPQKAADWAVLVLGDIKISHAKVAGSKDAKAGIGLATLLQSCPKIADSKTCTVNVADFLWKLVDGKLPTTDANLKKLSAGNILITQDIISATARLAREEQILTVSKLAEEIAIQNLLEEALMLKRLLQAGFQIQEVQRLKPVQTMVLQAIKKLDSEINELSFEQDVRKRMMTNTLNVIMGVRDQQFNESRAPASLSTDVIKEGAVYKQAKKERSA